MEKQYSDLLNTIAQLALLVGLIFFKAFVFIKMWTWFVIPTFTNAAILNYPAAIGISSMIGLLTYKESSYSFYDFLFSRYTYYLVALLIAWIAKSFM